MTVNRGRLFVAVAIAYALGSQLAFSWFGADGANASFFPAAGVTLAALVCVRRHEWWVVLVAAGSAELVLDLLHGITLVATLGYLVANLAQPLAGAVLLTSNRPALDVSRIADLVRFFVAGVLVAPIVGGVIGATTFVVLDGSSGWLRFASEWWIGDGLGILVVGGAILAWVAPASPTRAGRGEAIALIVATVASTAVLFRLDAFGLLSVPQGLMMATAIRVRTRGVALAGAGAGFAAAAFTAGGHQFWASTELAPARGLLYLQLAIAVTLATALGLAAEINAREQAASAMASAQLALRHEHELAERERLLALVGAAMDAVPSVTQRCQALANVLHEELGCQVTLHLADPSSAPPVATDDVRVIPLAAGGAPLGELWMTGGGDSLPTDEQLWTVLRGRVTTALDNAALYERERDASYALQLGLLGGALPSDDRYDLAAAYLPASDSLHVGGDWHDAFRLSTGRLGLVIGDVVGHGLGPAVTMGRLRAAVQTLASFASPAAVLEHLDDYARTAPDARCATIAYLELDPESGHLTIASAGHPPPLLLRADGTSRFLWSGRSAPLGLAGGHERTQSVELLARGEMVLLYTDGLIERRGQSIDDGMERLRSTLHSNPPSTAQGVVDQVITDSLDRSAQEDDVCVLTALVQPEREPFRHLGSADPGELSGLRADLQSWLRGHAIGGDDEEAILIATSEAAANAIEHAYSPTIVPTVSASTFEVRAALSEDSDRLTVVVRDEGRWLDREPLSSRGRGIGIMGALMEGVDHQRTEDGTLAVLVRRLGA